MTENITSLSKNVLKPLIENKINEYKQLLIENQSSQVQLNYFHNKIEQFKDILSQLEHNDLDIVYHQPLTEDLKEEPVISCTFKEKVGCMHVYSIKTNTKDLKIQFDSITFQIDVFDAKV